MRRRPPLLLALLLLALALGACGRSSTLDPATGTTTTGRPALGAKGGMAQGVQADAPQAAADLGFPGLATKNTVRIAGADPIADAAGTALMTFPATSPSTRPAAVALADARDWRTGLLASVLAGPPVGAAVLLTDGGRLPAATTQALARLRPTGARPVGGAQVVRVGASTGRADGLRTTDLAQGDPFALARAVDALQAAATGRTSDTVLLVAADRPAYAMPAAAWAAKAGTPILFTERDRLPAETRRALKAHRQPRIYVLGPRSAVSDAVLGQLKGLGTAKRIGDEDPIRSAVAFARYTDGDFGFGAVDPGHGFTFARADRPSDAAASALLAAHGSYAPLLLLRGARSVDPVVQGYLLDVQPGYTKDPVRGVYNRGFLLGDDRALSVRAQAGIDALLEIKPVTDSSQGSSTP